MSLARVKVWNPGDVLTASDLNSEFNNVLSNPISLISPSTGAINFNLQSHTGLLPSVISASSGTAGQSLTVSGGAAVWATPSVTTSSPRIVQIVSGAAAGPVNATTTSFADAGVSISITPASTDSRLLLNYSMTGQSVNLSGVNNAYQVQIATSTGAIANTTRTVEALSGAGGIGSIGSMSWSIGLQTTAAGPIGFKLQHMFSASSGAIAGNGSNFYGYIMELSS